MRPLVLSSALVVLLNACSKQLEHATRSTTGLPPRLDSHFAQYCDYTGGLGIGFDGSDTYDYRFRQRLKTTHDPELKRLFVLQHLHRETEFAMADFKKGIVRTGKTSSQPLTLSEWQSTRQSIQAAIDDLAAYSAFTNYSTVRSDLMDPPDQSRDAMWIEELRAELRGVTNVPAANQSVEPTATRPRRED